jgi:general secretion pathway protein C
VSTANIRQHPLYSSLTVHGQRIGARLRQVPMHRWRSLCLLLVAIWIVHSLAEGFWLLLPSPGLEQPPLTAQQTIADTTTESANIDLAALQQLSLFGEGGAAAPIPEPEEQVVLPGIEQEAVDTSLNLQLQGVIASSDPDMASAIIAEGNEQALYKVGDTLPQGNNVRLVKVLDQRVILDNNGRYESLWLYSKEDARLRASTSYDTTDYDSEPQNPGYITPDAGDTAIDYPPDPVTRPYNGSGMGEEPAPEPEVHTLPPSATDIKSISEVVRFTAARGDDGMTGYRVQPGRNRDLFDQAGLKPGDIVTAVNGINLDDPQQIRAVYQELQTATQAELSILRDGEPVSIYISLDSAR